MMAREKDFTGDWRIIEMELWDRDDLDLVGRVFISGHGRGRRGVRSGLGDTRRTATSGANLLSHGGRVVLCCRESARAQEGQVNRTEGRGARQMSL